MGVGVAWIFRIPGEEGIFFVRKGVGLFYNFLSIFWNTVER